MRAHTVSVPLFDTPDAATPTAHLELDRKLVEANGAYLVPVRGDHLREEGVRAGDLLLIEPVQPAAIDSGDIVVAGIGGAVQALRCMRDNAVLVLEPASIGEQPIRLTLAQAGSAVLGRATGVIRRLRPVTTQVTLEPDAIPA
jgi:SOS-response transcriptional repressor LexA